LRILPGRHALATHHMRAAINVRGICGFGQ
jgi:hypothetical protein